MSKVQQRTSPTYIDYEDQILIKKQIQDIAQRMSHQCNTDDLISVEDLLKYLNPLQKIYRDYCPEKPLSDLIREWVESSEGTFLSSDVDREFNLTTRTDKLNRSQILRRIEKEENIVKHGNKKGQYRIVDKSMKPMNWQECDVDKTYELHLPLNLHKLMHVYPKNIIVIAGDTNAGKTAYLLNIVRENASRLKMDYFTNDLTPEELKKRIQRFTEAGMDTENFDKCNFIGKVKNFIDILDPDALTIIDYLKLTDKFWLIAEEIDTIYNKLKKGICIVAIQKAKGQKMGRGGDFAAEASRLYFTMEEEKITIHKMKNLIDPNKNPNGKYVKFSLWGGCKFIPRGGWRGGSKKETDSENQGGFTDELPL